MVPVVGATYNEELSVFVPVGGTHISPFTGTRVPLELGDLMLDADDRPCAILSVGFNAKNALVPIGGYPPSNSEDSEGCYVLGSACEEPMSGLPAFVGGLWNAPGSHGVACSIGSPENLLQAIFLKQEGTYLDALRELHHFIATNIDPDQNTRSARMYPDELEAYLSNVVHIHDDTEESNKKLLASIYGNWLKASRARGQWEELAKTGGVIGKISFGARRQLPILVGVKLMHAASQQEVPVLGMSVVGTLEETFPLGGVVVDPKTGKEVPITIAQRYKDIRSIDSAPLSYINSAVVDSVTDMVTPSAESGFSYKPDAADYYLSHGVVSNYATLTKDFHVRVQQSMNKLLARCVEVDQTPADKAGKVSTEMRKLLAQLEADREALRQRKSGLALGAATFPSYVRGLFDDEEEWTANMKQLTHSVKQLTTGLTRGAFTGHPEAKQAAEEAIAKVYASGAELLEGVTLTDVAITAGDTFLEAELSKRAADKDKANKPRGMQELLEKLATTLQGISTAPTAAELAAAKEAGAIGSPDKKMRTGSTKSSSSLRDDVAADSTGAAAAAPAEKTQADKDADEAAAIERAKVEGKLVKEETERIREVHERIEKTRKEAMKDLSKELIQATLSAETVEEKAEAFTAYQEKVVVAQVETEGALKEDLDVLVSALAMVRCDALAEHELDGDEDVVQTKDRLLREALEVGSADDVVAAGSLDELRLRMADTRTRLEATSKRDAKLRNRLAAKLKLLQKEEKAMVAGAAAEDKEKASTAAATDVETKTAMVADIMTDLTENIVSGEIRLKSDANLAEALKETNTVVTESTKKMDDMASTLKEQIKAQMRPSVVLAADGDPAEAAAAAAELDKMVEEQLALISSFVSDFNEKTVEEETAKVFAKVVHEDDQAKTEQAVSRSVEKKKKNKRLMERKVEMEAEIKQEMADKKKQDDQVKHTVNDDRSLTADTNVISAVDKIQAEVDKKVEAKMAILEAKYIEEQVALRTAQEAKMADMDAAMQKELAEAEKEAMAELEVEQKKKQDIQKMNRGHEAGKADVNEDAILQAAAAGSAEELLREQAQIAHEVETKLKVEKQKNSKAIKEKLAKAKARKMEKMKLQQELEQAEANAAHQAEVTGLVQDETSKAEASVLKDHKKAAGKDDAEMTDKMIFSVLQHRHKEESAMLEVTKEKDTDLAVAKAMAAFEDVAGEDRARLAATHKAELASADEGVNRDGLKKKHESDMEALEDKIEQRRASVEKQAKMAIQLDHSNAKLALREKQYQEIAATFKKLSPDAGLIAQYEEAADAAKKNAADFKAKLVQQQEERMRNAKDKQSSASGAKRAAVQAEIDAIERDLEVERKREESRQNQKKAEQESRAIFLASQAAGSGDQSQEMRDKLLLEHESQQAAIELANAQQKGEHEDALSAKLAKRRAAKVRRRLAELRKQDAGLADSEMDEARRAEEMALMAQQKQLEEFESQHAHKSQMHRPATAARGRRSRIQRQSMRRRSNTGSSADDSDYDVYNSDEEGEGMSGEAMALVKRKVQDIERIMGANASAMDMQLADKDFGGKIGEAKELSAAELTDAEYVILQFAQFVFKLVGRTEAVKASQVLPVSTRTGTSYQNSYLWQSGDKEVFLRRARLYNVGECLVVAIHAAAYVGTNGEAQSDGDPEFMAELHRCVALVYTDLFTAASSGGDGKQRLSQATFGGDLD
jgi:hypothetical protein